MNQKRKPEVPERLKRAGITGVSDNLDGREIVLPKNALFDFFREELIEKYVVFDDATNEDQPE